VACRGFRGLGKLRRRRDEKVEEREVKKETRIPWESRTRDLS